MTAGDEAPLAPDRPICDAHHHLWRRGAGYLLDDLRADAAALDVETFVFVECLAEWRTDGPEAFRPVGETEFVAAEADRSDADGGPAIAGIVGYADLREPAIADVLAAHVEAGRGRFRGIRQVASRDDSPEIHPSHTDPPAGLLADPDFRRGLRVLGSLGLSYDAWLYHPQLAELAACVRAVPETPVVVDHLGGPIGTGPYAGRRDEVRAEWRAGLTELAACENVVLKLGGIGMPIFGFDWHDRGRPASSEELADAWGDDIRWCIETFGVDRCLFESNFPVDRQSCAYTTLWNTFERITAGASADEKAALFHDTATRVYLLGE